MIGNIEKIIKTIISMPGGILLLVIGYRLIRISLDCTRIGHLALEIDCLIKEIQLGKRKKRKYVLFYDPHTIANKSFIDLLPSYIKVYPLIGWRLRIAHLLLDSVVSREPVHNYLAVMYKTAEVYNINAHWDRKNPVFHVPFKWELDKKVFFEKWGLPNEAEYVCIHAREGLYSPVDEHAHSKRNVEIDSYKTAVEYLVSRGLVVIRMGDSTMTPLDDWGSMVYDYATCNDRMPWLDLALSSGCLFFLGVSSGASLMASIFGKPVASVGMSLPFNFSQSGFSDDIGIPKLFRHKITKDYLDFSLMFEMGLSEFRVADEIHQTEYELVENSPTDITEVVEEMYLRLKNAWIEEPEDHILQQKMHALLRPGISFSYGTASRCGALFLRRYKHLLDQDVESFQ